MELSFWFQGIRARALVWVPSLDLGKRWEAWL